MNSRYFIQLSYDGSAYHGWQIQNNAKTIQEELNEALSTALRSEIYCVGCGRTDTGVHAKQFFAHFDLEQPLDSCEQLCFKLNGILPQDIAIQRCFPVTADAHTRFSATSRSYEYLITGKKDPFSVNRAFEHRGTLDIDRMNKGAAELLNHEDFTSFAKLHTDTEHNLCDLQHAEWQLEAGLLTFRITANRFLRNMVRAIVGTLVEVGRGKLSLDDVKHIIEAKDRSAAGFSAPAHGLYLSRVTYPKNMVPNE